MYIKELLKIFTPQRHKGHKVFLCELCAFVVKFGSGLSGLEIKLQSLQALTITK
jgi:hypothetical protein